MASKKMVEAAKNRLLAGRPKGASCWLAIKVTNGYGWTVFDGQICCGRWVSRDEKTVKASDKDRPALGTELWLWDKGVERAAELIVSLYESFINPVSLMREGYYDFDVHWVTEQQEEE